MRAVQIDAFGGADVLRIVDIPIPSPGVGEVLVQVARAGVNFIDVYMRSGIYAKSDTYKSKLPMTLGMEGAGIVAAIGEGIHDWKLGDRVAYCLSQGSYADYAIVPSWKLVEVPENVSLDIATALMLQGSTAHYLTHSVHRLEPGDVCLIHAGGGGVGQLLIQLAKLRGAKVITTVGSNDKVKIVNSLGADHVILYRQEDFRQRVLDITKGEGVHVAYDSVGLDTIHSSIRCVRRRGLCILFGASSGVVASIEPIELAEAGSIFFTRPHLADYLATAEERRARAADLFRAAQEQRLAVSIHDGLPLEQTADAHRALEGRASLGKFMIAVS